MEVGPSAILNDRYSAARSIDAAGKLVMPGLVNTHTHAAMTLFRGLADDLPLDAWLTEHIWPAEAKFITAESVRSGANLAIHGKKTIYVISKIPSRGGTFDYEYKNNSDYLYCSHLFVRYKPAAGLHNDDSR